MTVTPVEPSPMDESILNTIKKGLGLDSDYNAFDSDILLYINSVFSNLAQLGVGPVNGFAITSATPTWREFLGSDLNFNNVKTYMLFKVKMAFDPPQTAHAIAAIEKMIGEQEFRLSVHRESLQWAQPIDPTNPRDEDEWGEPIIVDGGDLDD